MDLQLLACDIYKLIQLYRGQVVLTQPNLVSQDVVFAAYCREVTMGYGHDYIHQRRSGWCLAVERLTSLEGKLIAPGRLASRQREALAVRVLGQINLAFEVDSHPPLGFIVLLAFVDRLLQQRTKGASSLGALVGVRQWIGTGLLTKTR